MLHIISIRERKKGHICKHLIIYSYIIEVMRWFLFSGEGYGCHTVSLLLVL